MCDGLGCQPFSCKYVGPYHGTRWGIKLEGITARGWPSRVVAAFWLDWGEIGVVQGVLVCGLRTGQDPCGVVWVSVTAVTWRKHVSVIEKNLNVLVAL